VAGGKRSGIGVAARQDSVFFEEVMAFLILAACFCGLLWQGLIMERDNIPVVVLLSLMSFIVLLKSRLTSGVSYWRGIPGRPSGQKRSVGSARSVDQEGSFNLTRPVSLSRFFNLKRLIENGRFYVPAAFWLLFFASALSLTRAVYTRDAIYAMCKAGSYLLVTLALRALAGKIPFSRWLARATIIAGAVVAMLGLDGIWGAGFTGAVNAFLNGGPLAQGQQGFFFDMANHNRLTSLFQYPNTTASFLAASWFAATHRLVKLVSDPGSPRAHGGAYGGTYGGTHGGTVTYGGVSSGAFHAAGAANLIFMAFILTFSRGMYIILAPLLALYILLIPSGQRSRALWRVASCSLPGFIPGALSLPGAPLRGLSGAGAWALMLAVYACGGFFAVRFVSGSMPPKRGGDRRNPRKKASAAKAGIKPEIKPETKPEVKHPIRPGIRPDTKPEDKPGIRPGIKGMPFVFIFAGIGICVLLIAAAVSLSSRDFFEFTSYIKNAFNPESLYMRFGFYLDGMNIFADYPLTGIGGDCWRYIYASYQKWPYVSNDPHSFPMKLLVDYGIPGVFAFASIAAGVITATRRCIRLRQEDDIPVLMISATLLAHSMVDVDFTFYGLFMIFVFALSAINAPANAPTLAQAATASSSISVYSVASASAANKGIAPTLSVESPFAGRVPVILAILHDASVIAVLIITCFFSVRFGQAINYQTLYGKRLIAGETDNAVAYLHWAISKDSFKPEYKAAVAKTLVGKGVLYGNEFEVSRYMADEALKQGQYSAEVLSMVAEYYLATGENALAWETAARLTDLAPFNSYYWFIRARTIDTIVSILNRDDMYNETRDGPHDEYLRARGLETRAWLEKGLGLRDEMARLSSSRRSPIEPNADLTALMDTWRESLANLS